MSHIAFVATCLSFLDTCFHSYTYALRVYVTHCTHTKRNVSHDSFLHVYVYMSHIALKQNGICDQRILATRHASLQYNAMSHDSFTSDMPLCNTIAFDLCRHTRKHLQHTATHCNTLQQTATHCNTLQLLCRHRACVCDSVYQLLCRRCRRTGTRPTKMHHESIDALMHSSAHECGERHIKASHMPHKIIDMPYKIILVRHV